MKRILMRRGLLSESMFPVLLLLVDHPNVDVVVNEIAWIYLEMIFDVE